MILFNFCGYCGKILIPFFHKKKILPISGEVHKKCFEDFNKKSVLFQVKGIARNMEEEGEIKK